MQLSTVDLADWCEIILFIYLGAYYMLSTVRRAEAISFYLESKLLTPC